MSDYNEEVLESLEDFPTTADRFIFAEEMKEYKKGDSFYDIGGASFIASAMNELTSRYEEAHIFLLSDLLDNDDADLKRTAAFYGEITILLYPADDYYGRQTEFYLALKEAYPYATINVRDVDGGSTFWQPRECAGSQGSNRPSASAEGLSYVTEYVWPQQPRAILTFLVFCDIMEA